MSTFNNDANVKYNEKVYGVAYTPLICPHCQSKHIKCYSSHSPVRYHKCKSCGWRFKSIEKA